MPIVDVQLVQATSSPCPPALAQVLVDACAAALQAPAGRVWLRLHTLPSTQYAENGPPLAADELPVFVQLLQAVPPEGQARAQQAAAVAEAVARCVGRPPSRVHVEYAPAAMGRIAFGGQLMTE